MKTRKMVLCGGNLVMAAIGASLKEMPGFQVEEVKELPPWRLEKPGLTPPDVILFDLAQGQPHFFVSLLRNYPGAMLIGIDLLSKTMLVLSCRQSRLLTAEDLVAVMKGGDLQEDSPMGGQRRSFSAENLCPNKDNYPAQNIRRKDGIRTAAADSVARNEA